eukprot:11981367-Alexandrium_andersonii.AAC.1
MPGRRGQNETRFADLEKRIGAVEAQAARAKRRVDELYKPTTLMVEGAVSLDDLYNATVENEGGG